MQLDACLRSFALQCEDHETCRRRVICKCSDPAHAAQYSTLQTEHPGVEFIAEQNFHQDLRNALAGFEYVLFSVDDNTFIRPFSLAKIASALASEKSSLGFSLRLGRNITRCYPHNDAPQAIPEAADIGDGILLFRWTDATLDFGYPLEVSSSVFRTCHLLPFLQGSVHITHPNHLEECIDRGKTAFAVTNHSLMCFEQSVAFCNPINVVQQTHHNRVGSDPSQSSLSLMERFDLGYRINLTAFQGITPSGCHQEVPLTFSPPRLAWDSLTATLCISASPKKQLGSGTENPDDCSLRSVIRSDEIKEEDLYATLLSLRAVQYAAHEDSAAWLCRLGTHFLHQRKLLEHDLASLGKVAGTHLAKAQLLETQLKAINDELSTTREREARMVAEAVAEAEREKHRSKTLEKILDKPAFRALIKINKLVRFTKSIFTFPITWNTCHFRISEAYVLPNGLLHIQGMLLCNGNSGITAVRALLNRHDVRQETRADQHDRPDLVHLYLNDDGAALSFTLAIPLGKGLNVILLQYQRNQKWRTFNRHDVWNQRFKRVRRRAVLIQEPWKSGEPLVSVVVVCHSSPQKLARTIASVRTQTWDDWEMVIVDCTGSSPNEIATSAGNEFPCIRLIHKKGLEKSAAKDAGISEARGKYVCCLLDGDSLKPTYLEKCIFRLDAEKLDICDSSRITLGRFSPCEDSLARRLTHAAVFSRAAWSKSGGFSKPAHNEEDDCSQWLNLGKTGAVASTLLEPHLLCDEPGSPANGRAEDGNGLESECKSKGSGTKLWELFPSGRRSAALTAETEPVEVENPLVNLLHAPNRTESLSPNVLVCLPYLAVGGAERIISQVCIGLAKRGFQITILTTQNTSSVHGSAESWFENATERIYCIPRFLESAQWKRFILYLIHRHKVDILWQAGSALIYELMPDLKTAFPQLKIADILFNEIGHTANNRRFDFCIDITITENALVRAWLLAHGETAERIRVIPNGIDLKHFSKNPDAPKSDEGMRPRFVVGFFGRLSPEKAPDLFVEIAARFKDERRIRFLLAGDGPMMDEITRLAGELGLDGKLEFLGFTDCREYLTQCDVVIAPSRLDGRPNSVMESLAMGIPVIASDVGGMGELIANGHTGYLCDSGQVEQFAEKLAVLFKDRVLCKRLGENGRQFAQTHFDIRATIDRFECAFRGLLENRRADIPNEAAPVL